jgi:hypothetical protein
MKLKPVTTLNGETTWCGPSVISSITGFPVALIVRVIKDQRIKRGFGFHERWLDVRDEEGWTIDEKCIDVERPVKGTYTHEVNECLKHYGYHLVSSANRIIKYHDHKNNLQRPTLAKWLRQRKDRNELNLVDAGCHWVLVKGVKFVDSFTQVPVFIRKAPHRRARVVEVHKVERFGKRKLYRN